MLLPVTEVLRVFPNNNFQNCLLTVADILAQCSTSVASLLHICTTKATWFCHVRKYKSLAHLGLQTFAAESAAWNMVAYHRFCHFWTKYCWAPPALLPPTHTSVEHTFFHYMQLGAGLPFPSTCSQYISACLACPIPLLTCLPLLPSCLPVSPQLPWFRRTWKWRQKSGGKLGKESDTWWLPKGEREVLTCIKYWRGLPTLNWGSWRDQDPIELTPVNHE